MLSPAGWRAWATGVPWPLLCASYGPVRLHVRICCSFVHLVAAVLQDIFERIGVIVVMPLILCHPGLDCSVDTEINRKTQFLSPA